MCRTGSILLRLTPLFIKRLSAISCIHIEEYHDDGDYIIKRDSIVFDKDLNYQEELITILDRDVSKLRTKDIKSMKFQWKHCPVEKAT